MKTNQNEINHFCVNDLKNYIQYWLNREADLEGELALKGNWLSMETGFTVRLVLGRKWFHRETPLAGKLVSGETDFAGKLAW